MKNNDETIELFKNLTGYASTILLAMLYFPQIYKVVKTGDAKGMSPGYLTISILLHLVATGLGQKNFVPNPQSELLVRLMIKVQELHHFAYQGIILSTFPIK